MSLSGGESVAALARVLSTQVGRSEESLDNLKEELAEQEEGKVIELERIETTTGTFLNALMEYDSRQYSLTTVPNTDWVAISSGRYLRD